MKKKQSAAAAALVAAALAAGVLLRAGPVKPQEPGGVQAAAVNVVSSSSVADGSPPAPAPARQDYAPPVPPGVGVAHPQIGQPTPVDSPPMGAATAAMLSRGFMGWMPTEAGDALSPVVDRVDDFNNPAWFASCPANQPLKTPSCGGSCDRVNNMGNRIEPHVSRHGLLGFFTTNVANLKTTDGGTTWSCKDPAEDMHAINPGTPMCCNQEILYDVNRNLWIWLNLNFSDPGFEKTNWVFYQVGGLANNGWCHINFGPAEIGFTGGPGSQIDGWRDAKLTSTHLWAVPDCCGQGAAITAISLDQLAQPCGSTVTIRSIPNQGTSSWDIMQNSLPGGLLLTHADYNTTNQLQVMRINDTTMTASAPQTITLPFAWNNAFGTHGQGGDSCANWTWVQHNTWSATRWHDSVGTDHLMVFWTAGPAPNTPYGVIEVAQLNLATLAFEARPTVWSDKGCLMYPAFASNNAGDIGMAAQLGQGDAFNRPPHAIFAMNREVVNAAGVRTMQWESPLTIFSSTGANWSQDAGSTDDNAGDRSGIEVIDGPNGSSFSASAGYWPSCTSNGGQTNAFRGCAHPVGVVMRRRG